MIIEEIEPKIERHEVELMIADWKKRIADLYATMSYWLKDTEYTLGLGPTVPMYEELMYLTGIPETGIDTADIYTKDKEIVLTIMPVGLWVIGANGRVDLLSSKGVNYLIDISKQFNEPHWIIYYGMKNGKADFDKQELLNLLK